MEWEKLKEHCRRYLSGVTERKSYQPKIQTPLWQRMRAYTPSFEGVADIQGLQVEDLLKSLQSGKKLELMG